MSTVESPVVDNGVNVEALLGARQALAEAPEAAQFRWRARCEWVNGTHSRTTVHDFFGQRDHAAAGLLSIRGALGLVAGADRRAVLRHPRQRARVDRGTGSGSGCDPEDHDRGERESAGKPHERDTNRRPPP